MIDEHRNDDSALNHDEARYDHTRPTSPVPAIAVGALTLGIGAIALTWWRSRQRETELAERTRQRLAPRKPTRSPPNAADIKVG